MTPSSFCQGARLAAFLFAGLGLAHAAGPAVTLTVDPSKVVGRIDERIYGHFLEHIYHSCNGGLWGELVWNRSFEFRPQPHRAEKPGDTKIPADKIAEYWTAFGPGQVGCTTASPLNSNYCAMIEPTGGETGVSQAPYSIEPGETYRGSLWARGGGRVVVRLLDGQKVLAELALGAVSPEWREYPLALQPSAGATHATLQIAVAGAPTWIDQVSLMPDSWRKAGGLRPDLLQAIADLRPPVMRWPGGSFANKYRWKSGIGPQHQRVSFPAPMWDDLDVNAFGTDEFVAMCRRIGTEPIMVVCIGQPDHLTQRDAVCQEAAEWVGCCNGSVDSKWGRVRAANGHPQPYRIKYWEIDNEVWKVGAADYVSLVRQFTAAMKQVDPTITVIACGSGQLGGRWPEGDQAVIAEAGDVVDYLSIHHYENVRNFAKGPAADEAFWAKLGAKIAASKNPELKLFVSEWNLQSTDWRTGLYAGGILNAFERHPVVGMATPALFLRHVSATKWDNAFINFDHRTWFAAPNYVVMKLYRDNYQRERIQLNGVPETLSAVATRSADANRVVLKVVNPSDEPADISLGCQSGFLPTGATLQLVAPDSLDARNTLERRDNVRPVAGQIQSDGATVRFSLPRWSVGVVNLTRAPAAALPLVDPSPAHAERIAWWREARFGMFIHWGLFAIPAGEWGGNSIPGNVEWIQAKGKIPRDEYAKLAAQFNPVQFDADAWIQLAKEAGMKYVVFVAKHHDGFAMFGSKVDGFNVVDATPWRRDPAKELAAACAREGIKFCVYYSQNLDWHDPNATASADRGPGSDRDFGRYMREKSLPQVRELLTGYGPLGLLWFDMAGGMTREQSQTFADLVRTLQPACLINSRVSKTGVQCDYLTMGDQSIPNRVGTVDWETPDTTNNHWGYRKTDQNWKTPAQLVFNLVDVVSKGGNYLLNIGPTAEGSVPSPCQESLRVVGRWLRTNGEAIYGAGATPFGAELGALSATEVEPKTGKPAFVIARDWRCTTKPSRLYVHFFRWPTGRFELAGLKHKVARAYLLADPERTPVGLQETPGKLTIALPGRAPDGIASVLCLELSDLPPT